MKVAIRTFTYSAADIECVVPESIPIKNTSFGKGRGSCKISGWQMIGNK